MAFFNKLGTSPVKLSIKEYYSAVERGVIDGTITGFSHYLVGSLYEVAPYYIDHPFYQSTMSVLLNLKKWKSLPKHLQRSLPVV